MYSKKPLQILFTLLTLLLILSSTTYAAVVHRVAPGENLFLVANSYRSTVNQIAQTNNLPRPDAIYPRQVLIIPGVNKAQIYRVQAGDSLYNISHRLDISLPALVEENKLWNSDYIFPGQVLFLPPKPVIPTKPVKPATYTVVTGDTFFKIAKKLNVYLDDLISLNNLNEQDYLYPGQILKIPTRKISKPIPINPVPQLLRDFPDVFFIKGPAHSKQIALTFDDAPDAVYTEQVLDVLKTYDIPATFFLVGTNVKDYPQLVERMVREEHVVANHSWSHPNLTKIKADSVGFQIKETEQAIEKLTGLQTALIRPPYGAVSREVVQQLKDSGYAVINWSVDSQDWRDRDVDQILINTLPGIKKGAIILLHSAGGTEQNFGATVKALPELIETLKFLDYEFVTVDKLLNIPAYQ